MALYTRWPGIERAPLEFLAALQKEGDKRGWDVNALLGHISSESGFKTDAGSNSSTAGGLIQMIDSVSRRFAGVSSAQLRQRDFMGQLPAIVRYFDIGKPLSGADFRILGFARNPSLIGKPDSTVLYAAGSSAARVNPTFTDSNGDITLGVIRSKFRDFKNRYAGKVYSPDLSRFDGVGAGGFAMFALAVGTGWYLWKGKRK